ncbi:MAG: T9SS type A sorting domain-containing protein [Mariniphaga sp.]|nr:T9SS type A sorting domain-containing protein [Mariniphaga sp.]
MFKKGIDKAVSKEGEAGWVTVWINGKVGSAIGYGAHSGITAPVTITNNEWDPTMRLKFEGLELKTPFYNISAIESDGVNWGEVKKTNAVDLKVSAFELGFNISRFEINIDRLNEIFNSAYNSSLSDGILTSNSTNSFFSRIIDLDNLKLVPNKTLKEYDESKKRVFRPFSSNDNNIVGVEGVINFLNGGIDKNDDSVKDNVYPVIPNVYGLTHFDNEAVLTFQNTSEDETADFYIKVVNVPYGWIIDSQDKKEYTLFPEKQDYTFASFGAPKSLWNTFHSTKWTIGCIDAINASDDAELTFELWHNKSGFDKLLQTKKLTVHKQKADGNTPPTISVLRAIAKNENPTKNIEISWMVSNPNDDATIAIAIDFDKLSDKPWEASGIHRWIATGIKETSSINTFNWDITGVPTGTYSLWAVIYDGKNQPQYIKSNDEISISSLFDTEKPFVKINANNIEWLSFNKNFDIDFFDNIGLNDVFYQLIPKDLNKNAEVSNYSLSEKFSKLLLNESNWNFLTSNGTSILPESQFSLKVSLTEDWKINNSDWEKMVNNSQIGETFYLFLKATDDAGNTFISNDESEAIEIRIDIKKPNISFTSPTDGQRINSRNVSIKWISDDIFDGVELSGVDSIYIALENPADFQKLKADATSYTFNNLSDGIHKVYLKAKDKAGNFSDLKIVQFSVNSDIPLPVVEITNVSGITMTKFHVFGSIKEDYNTEITSKGFCWSITPNPTMMLSTKTEEGAGNEIFINTISDLSPGMTYYLRCYATNCAGTAYSEEIKITTNSSPLKPSINTINISEIEITSAVSGGYIISDGEADIIAKGVCWSTNPNPTVNDSKTTDGGGSNSYSSKITGLNYETTYYVRAYATNSTGTSYGENISFTTKPKENAGILTDYDGNEYSTITIGNQIWMGQNLKTTKYNDGTPIPLVTDGTEWSSLTSPAFCWYNNDMNYKNPYGALYNWYAVQTNKLCPSGWHVPSSEEWNILTTYLGGDDISKDTSAGKLKESGTSHWFSPNFGATNETGFAALPGSFRWNDGSFFQGIGSYGIWWTASDFNTGTGVDAEARSMYYDGINVTLNSGNMGNGMSVRCICDNMVSNEVIIVNKTIKVYPNPTSGIITIEGLPENERAQIAIYDTNSRLIKKHVSHSSITEIDISDVVPGTYLLVINNQFEKTVKIIKE